MSNITITRYAPNEAKNLLTGEGFNAYIEGETQTGQSWILWLDEQDRPAAYFANRRDAGGVLGEPVHLVAPPCDRLVGDDSESTPTDLVEA